MNPSLLLIPDRYKASKLYSQIPDSGAGDLAFTRANDTATRVNSAGLIEKVRTNLLAYSNTFTDAAWTKVNVTLTAGQSDPDGSTNGTRVQFAGISYMLQILTSAFATASLYVRATSGTASIRIGDSNGNFTTTYSLTETWQRITTSGSTMAGLSVDSFIGGSWTAQDVIIAFAQLETGDIATPYIPTTTAAVSVGMLANIPRIDYTGGGCGKLLLEPQRTNVALFSEQFNNAYWVKEFATISANTTATLDPSGYNSADKLQEDNTNNSHVFGNDSISALSGQSVTLTIFAKAAERNWLALRLYDGGSSKFAFYNLLTGTLGNVTAGATTTITPYGNGWFRCSMTITMAGNSVTLPYVFTSTGNGTTNYVGTTGNGIYVWGIQQEVGAYPTSYIPTLGASVTRSADAASKTGISSLIGQTSGSVFLDIDLGNAPISNSYIMLRNAGITDYISLRFLAGTLRFEVVDDSVLQVAIDRATITAGRVKIAMAYSLNDFVMYANGTLIGTDTSGTVPTCDILDLNFNAPTANAFSINTAATYTTRLSNSELATLTSL